MPKGKRKDNLIASREQALLSRELVRLDRHVPVAIDWQAARVEGVNRPALAELFGEFGFRTLHEKFSAPSELQSTPAKPTNVDYQLIDTPERLQWLVGELGSQKIFSFDTETTDIRPRWAEIVGYSFAWADGEAYYVPVRAPAGDAATRSGAKRSKRCARSWKTRRSKRLDRT